MRLPHPILASEVARLCGGELHGEDALLEEVAPLESAGPAALTFRSDGRRVPGAPGLVLARGPVEGVRSVSVPDPLAALCGLLERWFPEPQWEGEARGGAWIGAGAEVHPTARLWPGAVVGPGARVGARTVLFPNAVLQYGVSVGEDCRIHAGAVIGADGFRYHPGADGLLKVPQVGGVRIGSRVEIGANTTIDRGFLADTVVGDGCKIDNLVQIGHNCVLGRCVIIVSQTGLSGSCRVGDGAILAGQVGVADHSDIGAGAKIGARSGIRGRIPAGEAWLGAPAMPVADALRVYAVFRHLPEIWRRIRGKE